MVLREKLFTHVLSIRIMSPSLFMSQSSDFRGRMHHNTNAGRYEIDHRAALFGNQYAAKKDDPELVRIIYLHELNSS